MATSGFARRRCAGTLTGALLPSPCSSTSAASSAAHVLLPRYVLASAAVARSSPWARPR